jgi:hypothetical protein
MNIPKGYEEELSKEFYAKCKESFAKGGFLTKDYQTDWKLDEILILDFFLTHHAAVMDSMKEKVEGEMTREYIAGSPEYFENRAFRKVLDLLTNHTK